MKDILTQDQRLVILRALAEMGYNANESILDDCLDFYAHKISRDLVRNHILWLEEQGLVTVERINGDFLVATITQRGLDVARGQVVVSGVKRPNPRR